MSKKHKNHNSNNGVRMNTTTSQQSVIDLFSDADCDDDGFGVLKPTTRKETSSVPGNIVFKSSKPSKLTVAPESVEIIHRPSIQEINDMISGLFPLVNDGKYGKAKERFNRSLFKEFVSNFDQSNPPSEPMMKAAKNLLNVAKSFFEYSDDEILTDKEYDDLLADFKKNGGIEPAGIVPKGQKSTNKVDIKYPTLHNNMDKCYRIRQTDSVPTGVKEETSFEEFLTRIYSDLGFAPSRELVVDISPKIDGVSVNGTVRDNTLRNPQSRGDTNESVAVPGLDGITISLDAPKRDEFGIQYELFCTDEDVKNASEYLNLDTPYVSPRHAATGILHRLGSVYDDRLLEFVNLYPINSEGLDGSYTDRMNIIRQYGIVPKDMIPRILFCGTYEEIIKKVNAVFQEYSEIRSSKSFAFDGIVITIADDEAQTTIGRQGRTNKFQIALKFNPTSDVASVKGVTLDSGRKGYRTVQVEFEHPVILDGVKYDHVPVLSAGIFDNLRLRRDSKVRVSRVGDVIPSISVEHEGTGPLISIPRTCPACGKPFSIVNGKYYCSNPQCKDNVVGRFLEFFTKMGLTGYGEAFCKMLHERSVCNDLAAMLYVDDETFRLANLKSEMGNNFHQNVVDAISRHRDYEVFGAMGFPGIGSARAKKILKLIPFSKFVSGNVSILELYPACAKALGNSDASVSRLVDALTSDAAKREFKEIGKYVVKITTDFDDMLNVGHSGKDLSDDMLRYIDALGFGATDGKAFDILIVPTINHESTKVQIARKKNVPIMTEDMFTERYRNELREASCEIA